MPAREGKFEYIYKINHPWKKYGIKHRNIARLWFRTIGTFGAAAAILTLYMTDWKVICKLIPYYNTKFKEESDE